ncbi:MAG: hypothetical protein U0165_00755 [Polyangiaceae bacterium]
MRSTCPLMLVALCLGALLPIRSSRRVAVAGVGGLLTIGLAIGALTQLHSASDAVKKHGQIAAMFVSSSEQAPAAE